MQWRKHRLTLVVVAAAVVFEGAVLFPVLQRSWADTVHIDGFGNPTRDRAKCIKCSDPKPGFIADDGWYCFQCVQKYQPFWP